MAPILGPIERRSGRIPVKEYFPGTDVDQPNYRVLLDGRTVGPYDRKTIVGMRIKHMLTGDHLLVAADGTRLTVRELLGGTAPGAAPDRPIAGRPAAGSPVRGTFTGILVEAGRRGSPVPAFKGELEVRVQADVLRLAGRRRRGLGWKDDRVKLALADVVHACAKGPQVDIWLQPAGSKRMLRVALHMFTAEAAEEFLACLPPATTDSGQPGAARVRAAQVRPPVPAARALAVAGVGVALVIALVLVVLVASRTY